MTNIKYVLGIPVPKPTCPAVEKIFYDFACALQDHYGSTLNEVPTDLINKFVDKVRVQATEPLRDALTIALERLYEAELEFDKYAKIASDLSEKMEME